MRNKLIYCKYATMICDYNFNTEAQKIVNMYDKMDPQNLFIHKVLNEWAPSFLSKIDEISQVLSEAGQF